MNNKLNSLCVIASLLLGSQAANADCYYSSRVPDDSFSTACNESVYRCTSHYPAVRHHYHHYKTRHHYYNQRDYNDCDHVARARPGHYSITTYMVYNTMSGNFVWVPSPCGCQGMWVRVESYPEFSYEPYHETGCHTCSQDVDMGYDMDMRTGDDVW
jgi:hypothetical protein